MDYSKMVEQLTETHNTFVNLPEPKNDKERVTRISKSGELLGALKAINCIANDDEIKWQEFLASFTR